MKPYDHKKIEKKWQKVWDKKKIYQAKDSSKKQKFYALIEFPYPSGEGLHVGHIRSNTAMDIISRKRRMEGFNVLYPVGWDAFGLPTENYAIKTGIHPIKVTKQNTDRFRDQLKAGGFSFDWSREVNTSDPKYYKWTQWIFLKLYEKGLAYKKKMLINWCPKDKIGLANEEVVDGRCERCGTLVEKREKEQWMLAITKYADRLDNDLDTVDYIEKVKIQQRNWIGRSEGSELEFKIIGEKQTIKVFTTRADTLFGVTYVVLAPEHTLVAALKNKISNWADVEKYIAKVKKETEIERTAEGKEKTGVELQGVKAVNPATGEEVPVWIADYVLAHYGTGAVMAVPAHDERDFAFAKKYELPIKEVVIPERIDKRNPPVAGKQKVERKNVHVIVRDPKTGKYLLLRWKKHSWVTFPMGGIEEGESLLDAARREVLEETGYKNLKNGKVLGGQVRAEYFAAHKDVNRVSYTNAVSFDLENEERETIAADEQAEHEVFWADRKELTLDFMTHAEMDIWHERMDKEPAAFAGEGVLVNSGKFDGMDSAKARKEITKTVKGKLVTTYKLRDWVFSRQRYWGEPIPMVRCEECGWQPVPEKQLPVELPNVKNYQPTDTGESPLAAIKKWVETKCPKCKGPARRETDTMPNWAGSSWYFLRYADPKNSKALADQKKLKQWMPVDWYNGGMEHTTLHLLYSRFWNKFLYDIGVVPVSEPYQKRTSHGFILAPDGEKMSKSRGNVINPDAVIETYGADTLRLYEMFMGPFDQTVNWSTDSIVGPRRFLERVWKLQERITPLPPLKLRGGDSESSRVGGDIDSSVHKTLKKVAEDIESMRFNTAVSALMILANELEKIESVPKSLFELFLKLLAPFAPHITDEIWANLGHKASIHLEKWPKADESKITAESVKIAVQINGRVRGEIELDAGADEDAAREKAFSADFASKWLEGKEIKKVIYVKGRLINIVAA